MPPPELIKDKSRFEDDTPAYRLKRFRGYASLAFANLRFAARAAGGNARRPPLFQPHDLDPCFFGANCPPSPTTALEDLMFNRLKELGLRGVRVDWGYQSDEAMAARWLDRLLAGGFEVLLHLVQPAPEASRMTEPAAQRRWAAFIGPILARYAGRIRQVEAGSTPNRHSWSGYTIRDYAIAARIAQDAADERGVELVGPNVSDFAPYFTIALLDACRRRGIRFAALTDNLFVDRAGAPETYDPSVFGAAMRDRLKMDLVGKSAALAAVGRAFGIPRFYSTYCYYTLALEQPPRRSRKRPARYISEDTYADYLVRYFVLSAAAGALDRVYWGNLAGYYKGVISDGYRHRPDPPTVHHKFLHHGKPEDYVARPAFAAFRAVARMLQDARFVEAISPRDPFVFRFQRGGDSIVAAWSAQPEGEENPWSGRAREAGASLFTRDGEPAEPAIADRLGPSPVFLVFPADAQGSAATSP